MLERAYSVCVARQQTAYRIQTRSANRTFAKKKPLIIVRIDNEWLLIVVKAKSLSILLVLVSYIDENTCRLYVYCF